MVVVASVVVVVVSGTVVVVVASVVVVTGIVVVVVASVVVVVGAVVVVVVVGAVVVVVSGTQFVCNVTCAVSVSVTPSGQLTWSVASMVPVTPPGTVLVPSVASPLPSGEL